MIEGEMNAPAAISMHLPITYKKQAIYLSTLKNWL